MVELNYLNALPLGGFSYENCIRNTALEAHANASIKHSYTKTGTTICGVVFPVSIRKIWVICSSKICFFWLTLIAWLILLQGGVCLAADTRATAGSTVADKNCEKLHKLAPNIFCAGAGTAADCDHVTGKSLQ